MKSRKEVNHSYYERRIKPFRKNKGVAQQMKMRCFMCGHFIDYKKYVEKQPSVTIDVRLWEFGGRANIKVRNFTEIKPEIRDYLRKVLANKLKLMLGALGEGFEPSERVFDVYQAPISRESYNVPINIPISTKQGMGVKIW